MHAIYRNCLSAHTAALTLLVVTFAFQIAPAQAQRDETITVASFGGSYARATVKAYHGRFTEETGVRINLEEYSGGLAQVRAQVETGNVVWDVIEIDSGDVILGCDEGLLEFTDYESLPPAPDGTPAAEDFVAEFQQECGVTKLAYSTVYAYNTEVFPEEKPTTMADFFDLEKFPGRRGLRRAPNANLEFALVADGVPVDQIYAALSTPEGLDRAFRKLDTIKDQVVWWETGAQPPQMLADKEVVMSMAWNGRIFNAWALEGQPLAIVWDGQILASGYMGILAGTPKMELAKRFLAFATSTQSLANIAGYIAYSPQRRSARALVDRHFEVDVEMAPHLPDAPENTVNVVVEDPFWWADNQDEMNERFAAWLIR